MVLFQLDGILFYPDIQRIFNCIIDYLLRGVFQFKIYCFVADKEMTDEERSLIRDLDKCDFGEIHAMHKAKVEARKNMSKEEKLVCNIQFLKVSIVIVDIFRFITVHFAGVERGQPENPR